MHATARSRESLNEANEPTDARPEAHRHAPAPFSRAFRTSLLLKAADAVLEIMGGFLFLVVSPSSLSRFVTTLTQHELSGNSSDLIASYLREAVAHVGGTRLFGAAYLLSHGLGKIILVVEIFRGRLWAYPAMLILLAAFIAYQSYRLAHGFSLGMFALTAFDMIVVWLTWDEYARRRRELVS